MKGQKIKEKKRMRYRHKLQLKVNLKNAVSIAPEANSELVTFLKVQCESCGMPTDVVRVCPADEYVYEGEILNVVCPVKE